MLFRFGAASFIALLLQTHAFAGEPLTHEPISPLPGLEAVDAEKVDIGRALFFEKALSRDGSLSCASCHDLATNGANSTRFSIGIGGAFGVRNTPTIFNSALNFRQFWDGRAATLEEQVTGPIENEIEMGSSWALVVKRLRADARYVSWFARVYGQQISKETVANAIATFERTLLTPNSKFDRYLKGDQDALSPSEKVGYEKFKTSGCIACHQGVNVGGNMFQTMGAMANFFEGRALTDSDLGRFVVTKREKDKFVFRVPSLRNVARTAPYFHDGSTPTLEGAVKVMGIYQLGRDLSGEDVGLIVQFLKTLNGDLPQIKARP